MNKQEKELFFLLCKFDNVNKENIEKLLRKGAATPSVLGHLFFNRMQGVAYGVLRDCDCLGKVSREFRNSLSTAYNTNIAKNKSFSACVKNLSELLRKHEGTYAMLKGALLCSVYPEGYRTSNDIDLLVHPNDVTKIGKTLSGFGFRQGNVRNGLFIPATRREIIESRMMRGETVPYILDVNLPGMPFLEVDLNFSLEYKNSDPKIIEELIKNSGTISVKGADLVTLGKGDFLIHLCNHLYKEATTYPWVKMKRDMTLYKYCDIYYLVNRLSDKETDILLSRIKETEMEKICSCVILWAHGLLEITNQKALDFALENLWHTPDQLHYVTDPAANKDYLYDIKDIRERFFRQDREKHLKEVQGWNR